MPTAYDTFKQLLKNAVKDPDFVRKNTTLQDPAVACDIQNRISALTPDINIALDYSSVIGSVGSLSANPNQRSIVFDPFPEGFDLSFYKDGQVSSPGKLFARVSPGSATPADGVRYLLSDSIKGVLLLDENLNIVTIFPGFAATGTSTVYAAPTSAITFTVAGVEYIAIAMGGANHLVNIYDYVSGAIIQSIGVAGVAGSPTDSPKKLNSPTALAFNTANGVLYIACKLGQPSGALSSTGFIAQIAFPSGTLAVFNSLYTKTDGSLLHKEVSGPKGLLYDTDLWIVNGNDEIGRFSFTTGMLNKFIAPKGYDHIMSGITDINVKAYAPPGGSATSGFLTSANVFPISTFVPGDTFNAKVDGGTTINGVMYATKASITGSSATYAAVSSGDHLDILIFGNPSTQVIVFDGTEDTQAEYLLKINAQIVQASIVDSAGQVKIQTDRAGSGAGGSILSSSSPAVLTALGLTASALVNAGPNSVFDVSNVDAANFSTFLTATFTGSKGIASDSTVTWQSNTVGNNSSVQWLSGTGVPKVGGFDFALHSGSQAGTYPAGLKFLYVANSDYGNVVVFDLSTGKVCSVLGTRALEDNATSQTSSFMTHAGSVDGILPDLVQIGGAQTNVIVVADATNKRVDRLNEDIYNKVNQVVFKPLSFTVPVKVNGWAVSGTVPTDMITVEYKTVSTDAWHILDQITNTPSTQILQFRMTVNLSQDRTVSKLYVTQLTIITEQA